MLFLDQWRPPPFGLEELFELFFISPSQDISDRKTIIRSNDVRILFIKLTLIPTLETINESSQ